MPAADAAEASVDERNGQIAFSCVLPVLCTIYFSVLPQSSLRELVKEGQTA